LGTPAGAASARQGGATWGDVDDATYPFGMAAPGGIISTTGGQTSSTSTRTSFRRTGVEHRGVHPVRRIDQMRDEWLFKSETYDNCNCAVNCGCQFNLPSTHGYCQSAFVGNIVEGHFNDAPLAGLNWAALYKWPGEIKDGDGKRQIIIDERADEAQRVALETIISGGACEPLSNLFSVFASTCSESCETLFLPIYLEASLELRTARVDIPGIMRSSGRPIIDEFTGQPFHIALARPSGSFEFTYAEIGQGTTSVTGDMEMAFEDSWAHFCVHHFDQHGLVRERSRLTAWLDARRSKGTGVEVAQKGRSPNPANMTG
jgi:hypothetical protein